MKQDIKKLLNLQNVWVDSWEIADKEITVKVRSSSRYCVCPHCTKSVQRVHQYTTRKIRHSIWQSRKVILHLRVRRFYCSRCQKAFSEYIQGFDKRRTTDNFRRLTLKDLARGSLSYVSKINDVSPSVLYSILKENHGKFKEINWEEQGEKFVLGIDEHSYRGRNLVLTATNITQKKLLMVGKDDRLTTLSEFLQKADQKRISEVCIDMKRGYLNTIQRELPGMKVTVDKFHVIAYANKNLDEVRSIVVNKGYHVRQILFKGKEKLNDKEKEKLENLFKYFDNFQTNAFTEGVHTKIKMIKRVSFGFRNIDNYIAKVTLAFIPFLILIQHTIC